MFENTDPFRLVGTLLAGLESLRSFDLCRKIEGDSVRTVVSDQILVSYVYVLSYMVFSVCEVARVTCHWRVWLGLSILDTDRPTSLSSFALAFKKRCLYLFTGICGTWMHRFAF